MFFYGKEKLILAQKRSVSMGLGFGDSLTFFYLAKKGNENVVARIPGNILPNAIFQNYFL